MNFELLTLYLYYKYYLKRYSVQGSDTCVDTEKWGLYPLLKMAV